MSFCGVNAHHQNGKAENRVKDVTISTRTSLLHAAHRWPNVIHSSLWPAAMKNYINLRNSLPTKFPPSQRIGKSIVTSRYNSSPLSRFFQSEVEPYLNNFKPFGYPVYVLEASLQSQKSHNEWYDRSKVGIFLCHSPLHARNVPLVLNTQTGNASPQFHCLFDPDFNTCKPDVKFQSIWQHKAKLHTDRKPTPSKPSPTQPHTATIKFFELAFHIPDHLSQPWDTTVCTPKPSVN